MTNRAQRRLDGRVVAITGGARGIGRATAQVLAANGAQVVLGDVDAEAVKATADALDGSVRAVELDVTDEDSFAAFVTDAQEHVGTIDVLINNAGIMPIGPFLDEPAALARRVLEVNVSGAMIGMKSVLPGMIERGSGHVVNIASVAGKSPVPGGVSYAASKAAIVSLTESARVEFASTGVSFTCVLPSFTNTELIAGTKGTRLVRTVEPEQVGAAVAKAIARDKADAYVPALLGPMVRTQPLLGRRLRDLLNRGLGAYSAFLDVDKAARTAYDRRIGAADDIS